MPGRCEQSEELLKKYQATRELEVGKELLKSFSENRKTKWIDCVESINFNHSSRKAWNVLSRLVGEGTSAQTNNSNIKTDQIADKLVENSKGAIDKQRKTDIKKRNNKDG